MTNEKPTAVDLYAGAGGFSLGLERAGIHVEAAFDFEEIAIETYNANRLSENANGRVADLAELNPADAVDEYGLADIDLVVGGPPCQSYSVMGRREGTSDDRGQHVHRYFDWVDCLSPRVFIMENVPAIKSMDDGQVIDDICQTGEDLGYTVEYRVLDASQYGVPQSRERIFIVGVRDPTWEWPEPTSAHNPLAVGHVLDTLMEIDAVPGRGETCRWAPNHVGARQGDETAAKHKEREYGKDVYGPEYSTQIRLDPRKPANTILASNAHFHPYVPRELTIREQAEIQTFNGLYEFHGTKTEQQRQVGNAVPPELALRLGKSVIDALNSGVADNKISTPGRDGQTELADFSSSD